MTTTYTMPREYYEFYRPAHIPRCCIDGKVFTYDEASKSELLSGNRSQQDWIYLGCGTIVGSISGEEFNFWKRVVKDNEFKYNSMPYISVREWDSMFNMNLRHPVFNTYITTQQNNGWI